MLFSGCCAVSVAPPGLGMEPQHHRSLVLRTEALAHDRCPDASRGAELRDLLEEVHVTREEERQARRDVIDLQAGIQRRLHVRDAVGQGERDLLRGGRARLTHVVAADRDRVPPRDPLGAVREQVGDQAHRWTRRVDVGAARRVLLQEVVLDGPLEVRRRDALLLGDQLVEQQQDRRGRVDRHRGRDLAERDAVEQPPHVVDRVDRDAGLADLALRERMVGVQTHLGREVERGRESGLAVLQEVAEAAVRIVGRAHPRVLPHRPETSAVHRGVRPACERERPRLAQPALGIPRGEILGPVHVVELDAGVGDAALLPHDRSSLAPSSG